MPRLDDEWIAAQIAEYERFQANPIAWSFSIFPAGPTYPMVLKELQDLRASFTLYSEAVQAGTELYREAHPELDELTDPDTAKLVAWLVQQLDRQKESC